MTTLRLKSKSPQTREVEAGKKKAKPRKKLDCETNESDDSKHDAVTSTKRPATSMVAGIRQQPTTGGQATEMESTALQRQQQQPSTTGRMTGTMADVTVLATPMTQQPSQSEVEQSVSVAMVTTSAEMRAMAVSLQKLTSVVAVSSG
ncbi:hypothetical protein PC128_g20986 [Phytophthora cactorum]|nr:hypothetical protein PC128_g20986 [Phytophthora cactorum]